MVCLTPKGCVSLVSLAKWNVLKPCHLPCVITYHNLSIWFHLSPSVLASPLRVSSESGGSRAHDQRAPVRLSHEVPIRVEQTWQAGRRQVLKLCKHKIKRGIKSVKVGQKWICPHLQETPTWGISQNLELLFECFCFRSKESGTMVTIPRCSRASGWIV